MVLIHLDIPYW